MSEAQPTRRSWMEADRLGRTLYAAYVDSVGRTMLARGSADPRPYMPKWDELGIVQRAAWTTTAEFLLAKGLAPEKETNDAND